MDNQWPEGVTDDYYDPIQGSLPYCSIWIDEEITSEQWIKGSEELLQRMKDRGCGYYIWSVPATRTDGLSGDAVESSRTG